MPRILDRYVLREILPPFLLSLLIFTFLLTLPPVMEQLERLVAKGVSWGAAGRIILTLLPQALGLTIPMATLTGILVALGRLSTDREAMALLACGVSPYRLLRPLLAFALVATGATAYVMFEGIPDANQRFREITWELVSKRVENDVQPRVFFEDFPGYVLYSRDIAPGGGWKDVLVADTSTPGETTISMAARGRLVLIPDERRVDLVLTEGTQYMTGSEGEAETYDFTGNLTVGLDADTVFGRQAIPRGLTDKTIADLRADADTKLNRKEGPLSPHPELIYIQQKFSIPVACLVFALIGLALGLSSARDGKMAGFVIGFAVVFAYYGIMELAAAHTRGHYRAIETAGGLHETSFLLANLARWWPNIILGLFGIGAVVWRARFAHRGLPISVPVSLPRLPTGWQSSTRAHPARGATGASTRGKKVVIVVRMPRLRMPGPGILDRYVTMMYLRTVGLSFLGLLGMFYISTFLDKAEKIFKGDASLGLVLQFLVYMTPQYIYFVVPLAVLLSVLVTFGLLARSSELTVLKACGISLYRISLPIIGLSLVGSALLFGLEQGVLAESNRKADAADRVIRNLPQQNLNPMNRRWIVARDGSVYHYGFFDAPQETLTNLTVYAPKPDAWRLSSMTSAASAAHRDGVWTARNGWVRDYATGTARYEGFQTRSLPLEPPDYFGTSAPVAELMT
ncbi:MAG: LptF/LptG family permease, partial [Vicinamibacterales bacterium]